MFLFWEHVCCCFYEFDGIKRLVLSLLLCYCFFVNAFNTHKGWTWSKSDVRMWYYNYHCFFPYTLPHYDGWCQFTDSFTLICIIWGFYRLETKHNWITIWQDKSMKIVIGKDNAKQNRSTIKSLLFPSSLRSSTC